MGNGVLVQQMMRDSYARQTGQVPNGAAARQGQHSQVGHPGTNARVTFGQEATDEEFEEVQVRGQLLREVLLAPLLIMPSY